MINYLTYCRVLRIEQQDLATETCAGNVRTVTTGEVVLARIRDLHAEATFLYKGHEIDRIGAWVSLAVAVEQAERASDRFKLDQASEGEVRVELRITEHSVLLVPPDRFDSSLRYRHTPEIQRAIKSLPGQREWVVINETVWSSKRSTKENAAAVKQALNVFEADGRLPQTCLQDVTGHFQRLTSLAATRPRIGA